jgi:N-formylglutamate deformylase
MYKDNTGSELFKDELKRAIILHIPHSSTRIPFLEKFRYNSLNLMKKENKLLTDHSTDKIFNIDGIDKLIFPYSRIFCDVERFNDEDEIMYKYGRGFYYTKTDSGLNLRKENNKRKIKVYNKHYLKHHNKLVELTFDKIKNEGMAIIIDCHSFSDIPFNTDLDKSLNRSDICIGIDKVHTPNWLLNIFTNQFKKYGLSVEIDKPYSGTILPMNMQGTNNLYSIMIEINRKLYIENGIVNMVKVKELNEILNNIFN